MLFNKVYFVDLVVFYRWCMCARARGTGTGTGRRGRRPRRGLRSASPVRTACVLSDDEGTELDDLQLDRRGHRDTPWLVRQLIDALPRLACSLVAANLACQPGVAVREQRTLDVGEQQEAQQRLAPDVLYLFSQWTYSCSLRDRASGYPLCLR
jgi:hypothetical protein